MIGLFGSEGRRGSAAGSSDKDTTASTWADMPLLEHSGEQGAARSAAASADEHLPSEEIAAALSSGVSAETVALFEELRNPSQASWLAKAGVLVVSLALFVGAGLLESMNGLMLVVLALCVHETGHYAAMRIFGYRDVQMFFIPVFGAAVSGWSTSVAGWKRTIVALAGPLPGIMLGTVLVIAYLLSWSAALREAGVMFVALNAFNLLPIAPLDGWHVLNETVLCRNRWLEATAAVVSVLALVALAVAGGGTLFIFLALTVAFAAHASWKASGIAADIRQSTEVPDLAGPPVQVLTFLDRISEQLTASFVNELTPVKRVRLMRTVLERLNLRPPRVLATSGLLACYAGTFVLAFAAVIGIAVGDHMRAAGPLPDSSVVAGAETTIYVSQFKNGVEVWIPVVAVSLGDDRFRLVSEGGERGAFHAGDIVRCERRRSGDVESLLAVEKIGPSELQEN